MNSGVSFRRALAVITRKEMREIVRDKRSLFALLLLPVALYPILFVGSLLAANAQFNRLSKKTHTVWVKDLERLPAHLKERLSILEPMGEGRRFRVELEELPADADVDEALRRQRVAAVLPEGVPALVRDETVDVEILFNGSLDTSSLIRGGIQRVLRDWRSELVLERLKQEGLSPKLLKPVQGKPRDRGPPGAMFGRMLAILIVILSLTSAFYPALDLGAGEKERGTLETLLLAPVPRVTLAMGKVLATFLIALASAALNLLSLGLTFASMSRFAPSGAQSLQLELNLWLLPVMLVVLVPLVLLFSALSLALSTFAASYKEGQAYLTPVIMIGTLPAMGAALPGVDLTPTLALVPVLGAVLLMKALLAQMATSLDVIIVTVSSLAYAGIGVRWVAVLYTREEVLWRPAAADAPDLLGLSGKERFPVPSVPQAAAMATVALLLFWFVGVPAQAKSMSGGLAFTLLVLIALPPLLYAKWLGCDLRDTFSVRNPHSLSWPCALLLAVGCLALNLAFVHMQGSSVSAGNGEAMRQLETEISSWSVPQMLLLVALLPALCEETLCRGFLLSGLRSEGGSVSAVLVSAIVFSVLHLDPARLVPTFFLGVVLAILVLRSGSLFPAMLLHFANNALALGLAAKGVDWGLIDTQGAPLARIWAIAIPCLVGGVALLVGLKPRSIKPRSGAEVAAAPAAG